MAALVITSAQVLIGQGANSMTRNAGVALTAGKAVYIDANNTWQLADADLTALEASAAGITLNDAAVGQPVAAAVAGPVTLGAAAAPAIGQVYCLGVGAGGIVPYADLIPTNRVTLLGWGIAGNAIQLAIQVTGVQKA